MHGRFVVLISSSALPLVLGLALLLPGSAYAHRLNAECHILSGNQVQVESWFETGDIPRKAKVQVFRANGQLLTEGNLNDQGIFLFSYENPEPLRVLVNAGAGHRQEIHLSAEQLRQESATGAGAAFPALPAPASRPLSDRSGRVNPWAVLFGVGLLVGVAAVALARRRQRLHQAALDHEVKK
ncbi:MAG: hypothetical protein ACK4RK_04860 [Gemmataceae bacterium]